jgi:hypothetical protein
MDTHSSSFTAEQATLFGLSALKRSPLTAIAQSREARDHVGRGRYSLWTGDAGLAVYLWDCLTAVPRFPTVDFF